MPRTDDTKNRKPHFVSYTDALPDMTAAWGWTDANRRDLAALADAIARGTVVAYVGAGPSIAAGLKGWNDLCKDLYEWVVSQNKLPEGECKYLNRLLENENLPLFLQIIENELRAGLLYDKLHDLYRPQGLSPSRSHIAIAMLPVPLRLTTNYEELLEQAIRDLPKAYERNSPLRNLLTWQDGAQLLELVRSGEPGLIKIHGDFSREKSIILTKSHFRRLSYESPFWSVLKALISTRTFLFIGCSLRDPDVFSLLDEVIEECRVPSDSGQADPGPPMHYALLPLDEANAPFIRHLRSDYQIATLPVPTGSDGAPDLPSVLRLVSGETARRMSSDDFLRYESMPRNEVQKARLSEIVRLTGSHRADVILTDGDATHQLKWWLEWDRDTTAKTATWRPQPPPTTGVVTSTFTEPVDLLSVASTEQKPTGVPYRKHDPLVRSELAVPIRARGERVGVLNVESHLSEAYHRGHADFLQREAQWIGAAHLDAADRNQRVAHLDLDEARRFEIIQQLRASYAGAESLRGILYTADYLAGKLRGVHRSRTQIQIEHSMYGPESSFAADVFREGVKYVSSVESALEVINVANAEKVGLKRGPLWGTQVFDRGLPSAVLVMWARQSGGERDFERCGLRSDFRRLELATIANLILAGYDSPGPESASKIIALIRAIRGRTETAVYGRIAAAGKALGLKRLRVWRLGTKEEVAEVVYASPRDHGKVIGTRETWVEDLVGTTYSQYCALVVGRYKTDPWARVQGPRFFDLGPDPLNPRLQKTAKDAWFVVPLVGGPENDHGLMGYLAADNGCGKSEFQDEAQRNWLQCGMSVIAVASAAALQQFRSWSPHGQRARWAAV